MALTWTIAYRKPRANRFHRVTDWAGTWDEAYDMSAKFCDRHRDLQVYYVPTHEAETTGYVPAEDVGNVLVDSGRRVQIVDNGTIV